MTGFLVSELCAEIERRSGGRLRCQFRNGAETRRVTRLAALERAGADEIAFLAQPAYRQAAARSEAGVLVLPASELDVVWPDGPPADRALALCDQPYAWFAWALQVMMSEPPRPGSVHPRALVEEGAEVDPTAVIEAGAYVGRGARIGPRTRLFPGAYVGPGAVVGADCLIYPNAVIYHRCRLGDRVIIHAGAVIGADGFGFAPFQGEWVKIPQIGAVRIGDDVEVGANTTIDRGAIEDTVIERGVKLDNQIQLAHNDRVGEHTAMAACTGVAGSTTIGAHCLVGGAANINGHITIPDGSEVGPATSIMYWPTGAKQMIGIFPAQPRRDFERSAVLITRLQDTRRRLQRLEAELERLRAAAGAGGPEGGDC